MFKILILTQFLNPGGLERLVMSLSRGLKQGSSWCPIVFFYDEIPGLPSLEMQIRSFGIEVHKFKKKKGFSFALLYRLWKTVRALEIRVVHSHDLGPWVYAILLKGLMWGRIRVVHTQHSRVYLEKDRKSKLYEWICLRFTDRVVLVSESLKEGASGYTRWAEKIRVIENGVTFPLSSLWGRASKVLLRKELYHLVSPPWRQALADQRDAYWILCLARVHPGKGQETVLQIWERLPTGVREKTVLLFVGPETSQGQMHHLEQLKAALPESHRIFFLGGTTHPEKWIAASHLFISGSRFEGMPLAPIEAAGAGLPLLLSDIPGHARLRGLPPQSTRFFALSEPETAAAWLSAQVEEAMHDEEHYYSQVWRETAGVRAEFGLPRMIQEYTALYQLAQR